MLNLNQDNFEKEVMQSESPIIIDFWANWCMPCKMLAPVFEELAEFYGDRLKFAKISTEEQPELAQKFEIRGIPALVIMKDGKIVDKIVGFAQKEAMKQKIDAILDRL